MQSQGRIKGNQQQIILDLLSRATSHSTPPSHARTPLHPHTQILQRHNKCNLSALESDPRPPVLQHQVHLLLELLPLQVALLAVLVLQRQFEVVARVDAVHVVVFGHLVLRVEVQQQAARLKRPVRAFTHSVSKHSHIRQTLQASLQRKWPRFACAVGCKCEAAKIVQPTKLTLRWTGTHHNAFEERHCCRVPGDPEPDEVAAELPHSEHAPVRRLREHGGVEVARQRALRQRQVLHLRCDLSLSLLPEQTSVKPAVVT